MRAHMKGFSLILLSLFLFSCQTQVEDIEIIDSHIHFFDPTRKEGVMWPPKTMKEIYKPTYPKHFAETAKANNVKKAVVVQASNSVMDAQWNLDITSKKPDFYAGIVCNLSTLGTKEFRSDIDKVLKNPRTVGLRITHPPIDRPFFSKEMLDDLRYVASKNVSLDILAHRFKFDDLVKIADEVPNLRIMIGLYRKSPEQINKMASRKNVYCKSGVPINKSQAEINEYLSLILKEFGEDRIVFGSNWPVTKLADYKLKKKLLFEFLKDKGNSAVEKIFHDNAEKFYRLKR